MSIISALTISALICEIWEKSGVGLFRAVDNVRAIRRGGVIMPLALGDDVNRLPVFMKAAVNDAAYW